MWSILGSLTTVHTNALASILFPSPPWLLRLPDLRDRSILPVRWLDPVGDSSHDPRRSRYQDEIRTKTNRNPVLNSKDMKLKRIGFTAVLKIVANIAKFLTAGRA